MVNKNIYPTDEIHLKKEYSSYMTNEEIYGGHKTYIKIPHKFNIKLEIYNLIPGISIIVDYSNVINNFYNDTEIIEIDNPQDTLIIDYLDKGQCRYQTGLDKYMFIKEKDINLYIQELNPHSFSYIGDVKIIHIVINKRQLKDYLTEHNQEYYEIIKELFEEAKKDNCIIFKSPENINQIINEFKKIDIQKEKSARLLLLLRTLECLVLLYEYGIEDEKSNQRTYTDAQIRVVRNIKNSLSRNIASYVSLDTLSMSYGINLTTLKNCFKDMYGKPLYTWYKEYKFYRAQELIKNTDYPISKIAHMIGYKSSSKFAKAFKKEMGVLPSSYRKNKK